MFLFHIRIGLRAINLRLSCRDGHDPNHAAVAGSKVTLVEVQTGITRTTTSDSDGSYEFVNLTQGRYRIEIENNGFRKFTTKDFDLAARQTVRIDASLITAGVTA